MESNNRLNIYGNALEVLNEYKEFFDGIDTILFQYFNFDLVTDVKIFNKLKTFKNLKNLIFSDNNLHSVYQLIKLEELYYIESITIFNNEITSANLIKYFLIYRFQNLKFYNNILINESDIQMAKKLFGYFDHCISQHENVYGEERITSEENKIPQKSISGLDIIENLKIKSEFFEYIKDNLADVLVELIEESIQ